MVALLPRFSQILNRHRAYPSLTKTGNIRRKTTPCVRRMIVIERDGPAGNRTRDHEVNSPMLCLTKLRAQSSISQEFSFLGFPYSIPAIEILQNGKLPIETGDLTEPPSLVGFDVVPVLERGDLLPNQFVCPSHSPTLAQCFVNVPLDQLNDIGFLAGVLSGTLAVGGFILAIPLWNYINRIAGRVH